MTRRDASIINLEETNFKRERISMTLSVCTYVKMCRDRIFNIIRKIPFFIASFDDYSLVDQSGSKKFVKEKESCYQ